MENNQYLNPFDNDDLNFLVLLNEKEQYSLWPEFSSVPKGWKIILGPISKKECIEYVERHWKAINPFNNTQTN